MDFIWFCSNFHSINLDGDCRKIFLKINYLQLVGIMSGSYTDPAALSFSTNYLDSDIPIQSYAQVYPLVTIARILPQVY